MLSTIQNGYVAVSLLNTALSMLLWVKTLCCRPFKMDILNPVRQSPQFKVGTRAYPYPPNLKAPPLSGPAQSNMPSCIWAPADILQHVNSFIPFAVAILCSREQGKRSCFLCTYIDHCGLKLDWNPTTIQRGLGPGPDYTCTGPATSTLVCILETYAQFVELLS